MAPSRASKLRYEEYSDSENESGTQIKVLHVAQNEQGSGDDEVASGDDTSVASEASSEVCSLTTI